MFTQLTRIARKMGVARVQCEDVAQEALLEGVNKHGTMPGEYAERQFCSWLLQCVGPHKAVDWLRHRKQQTAESLDCSQMDPPESQEMNNGETAP